MEKWQGLLRDKRRMLIAAAAIALVVIACMLPGEQNEGMTGEERRIAQTLESVSGAGRVRVTLYYAPQSTGFGSAQQMVGALAVASGAGDIAVRLSLTQALETLLDLPTENVLVLRMEEE